MAEFVNSVWSKATAILRNVEYLLRMNSNLVGLQSEQRERLEDEGTTLKWKKIV